MLQIRSKYLTYNPGVSGGPNSALGVTATRGMSRSVPGQEQAWWHLQGGTYQGHVKLLAVYFVSTCELRLYAPGSRDALDTVRTHSMEEGLANLGFTVELY